MSYITYEVRVYDDGTKSWFLNGQRHRVDGPACEWANGDKSWWLNDQLHRVDGPAIEDADGSKRWYLNGELHRVDGPACEYADGSKFWYLNGKQLTEEEFLKKTQPQPDPETQQISTDPCEGKVVEVDGKKYRLEPIE